MLHRVIRIVFISIVILCFGNTILCHNNKKSKFYEDKYVFFVIQAFIRLLTKRKTYDFSTIPIYKLNIKISAVIIEYQRCLIETYYYIIIIETVFPFPRLSMRISVSQILLIVTLSIAQIILYGYLVKIIVTFIFSLIYLLKICSHFLEKNFSIRFPKN